MSRTGLGQPNGVATLDANGYVPAAQLKNVPPVNTATSSTAGTVEIPASTPSGTPVSPSVIGSVQEKQIIQTTAQNVLSVTPATQGNFVVYVAFRVTGASATNVQIQTTYTSATGAQTNTQLNQSCSPNDYTLVPLFFNATAGSPITIAFTCGTANIVYASAAILAAA